MIDEVAERLKKEDVYGGRVAVLLGIRNFTLAREVIDEAERELGRKETLDEVLDGSPTEIGLSVRVAASLDDYGIITVRQLLALSPEELQEIRGINVISLGKIQRALKPIRAALKAKADAKGPCQI